MSGARKLKGYAAKLVPVHDAYKVEWAGKRAFEHTADKKLRHISNSYLDALCGAVTVLAHMPAQDDYRIRIVAIYTLPKRTAEQERADVLAYLAALRVGAQIADVHNSIRLGSHVGLSK